MVSASNKDHNMIESQPFISRVIGLTFALRAFDVMTKEKYAEQTFVGMFYDSAGVRDNGNRTFVLASESTSQPGSIADSRLDVNCALGSRDR